MDEQGERAAMKMLVVAKHSGTTQMLGPFVMLPLGRLAELQPYFAPASESPGEIVFVTDDCDLFQKVDRNILRHITMVV